MRHLKFSVMVYFRFISDALFLLLDLNFVRDFGWQQRYARFCGRVVVLSILSLLLYPFLCAWTVIGTLWFRDAKDCVSYIINSVNIGQIIYLQALII